MSLFAINKTIQSLPKGVKVAEWQLGNDCYWCLMQEVFSDNRLINNVYGVPVTRSDSFFGVRCRLIYPDGYEPPRPYGPIEGDVQGFRF